MSYKKWAIMTLLAAVLIGSAGWWASSHIEHIMRVRTGKSLQAILAGTTNAINAWLDERLADARSMAQDPALAILVEKQLDLHRILGSDDSSRVHSEIRTCLEPHLREKGYVAFFVFDRARTVLASSHGKFDGLANNLVEQGDGFAWALTGRTLTTPVMKRDTTMLTLNGAALEAGGLIMAILSPIKNEDAEIIAVLALVIDPSKSLARMTSLAGFEGSGETYAFDRSGLMVTDSRFDDQLRQIGLLKSGQSSAGHIEVRNPGGDMIQGFKLDKSRDKSPLTFMAAKALAGQKGQNLAGYRDYRGVMVVGAWTWNERLGLGLTTEVDKAEMFQVIDSIRNLSMAVLILTVLITGTLVAIIGKSNMRAGVLSEELRKALVHKEQKEKQRKEAEKRLIHSKESLAAAQAVAHVGSFDWILSEPYVVWSDEMYRIFGREKEGESVEFEAALEMIHPEDLPEVQERLKTLVEKDVAYVLDHRIVRPGGEVRWLEAKASVTRDASGTPVQMVGTVRDITEARAIQEELDQYRDNLEQQVQERTEKLTRVNQQLEAEIEEREHAEQRIRVNEARLNALVETAVEGIVTIDEKGLIRTFNPAAEKMFGYSAQELIGRNVNILMPEPIRSEHDGFVQKYIQTGVEHIIGRTREVVGLNKDGGLTELEISIGVFKDGEHMAFTGILHDISERKRNEMELRQAKQDAEMASQAKSRFLANMSHEIRTPMNTVIGYLDLALEDSELSSSMKKNLTIASRSAGVLLKLINDILDVSKMEAGKLELERSRFNLYGLLADVQASFKAAIEGKGLHLDLKINPDLSQCYLGDKGRLRQVLVNLLSNALKFTEKGGIALSVDPPPDGSGVLRFAVADTGIGIPEDKIESILEPFIQADVTTTRRFGGTGLGTTISRQIVKMMNGAIWIESEEGKGTTFYFTVDLPESECSATCTSNCEDYKYVEGQIEKPVSMRAFRVLLAEDLEENAELAKIRLNKRGHQVIHVWDGSQAVEAYLKGGIDLILMDVQMPNMDGLEATRKIRELESGSGERIPIIALTASVMTEEKERCLAAGMDYVVGKPVDFPILFARMEKVVSAGRGRMILIARSGPRSDPEKPVFRLPGIDFDRGLSVWQDEPAYTRALRVFAESHGGTGDEIFSLLDSGDMETAYQRAHALKGVAGNLSLPRVFSLATEVSAALRKEQVHQARNALASLTSAITEVVNGIARMGDHSPKASTHARKMDSTQVAKLLDELMVALGDDDPGTAEPFLNDLAEFLTGEQLNAINNALDLFDFVEAKDQVRGLAERLGIVLGDG